MGGKFVGYNFLKAGDSEKCIKNNFRIWILTYSPNYEQIVKKWYVNFISCSLNHKITYLKLVTKLVELKRKNLTVAQAIFFDILKMAFTHISKLAYNNLKLLSVISQVTSEWNHKNIFTSIQVKELQDLIISGNSNNDFIEQDYVLPLRIVIAKRRLGLDNCVAKISKQSITVTNLNFTVLKNHVMLLKNLFIDLHFNFTKDKLDSMKTFIQAILQNLDGITEENHLSLEVNRNLLGMMHKVIKNSERKK